MRLLAPSRRRLGFLAGAVVCASLLAVAPRAGGVTGQERRPSRHEFQVTASNYHFSPSRLTVDQGDIVKISFRAEDIAHGFAIDDYRIAKRAGVGQAIEFEFRATRAGRFHFYCNLALDERCSKMHGELVVNER